MKTARHGKFSRLAMTPLAGGFWKLNRQLVFTDARGRHTVIPAGFVTDLASVPDLSRLGLLLLLLAHELLRRSASDWTMLVAAFQVLAALIVWFAKWLDDNRCTYEQAILHDWRFATQTDSFMAANWELFATLGQNNNWVLRGLYFVNVVLFAYPAWRQHQRKGLLNLGVRSKAGMLPVGKDIRQFSI